MNPSSPWKNRIIGFGWIQDVIVNRRTASEWGPEQNRAVILDGHDRVKLALKKGEPSVPVKYVDLSPRDTKSSGVKSDRRKQT